MTRAEKGVTTPSTDVIGRDRTCTHAVFCAARPVRFQAAQLPRTLSLVHAWRTRARPPSVQEAYGRHLHRTAPLWTLPDVKGEWPCRAALPGLRAQRCAPVARTQWCCPCVLCHGLFRALVRSAVPLWTRPRPWSLSAARSRPPDRGLSGNASRSWRASEEAKQMVRGISCDVPLWCSREPNWSSCLHAGVCLSRQQPATPRRRQSCGAPRVAGVERWSRWSRQPASEQCGVPCHPAKAGTKTIWRARRPRRPPALPPAP